MRSHFDAWGLGLGEYPKTRKARIEGLEDLERVRRSIGEQNFKGLGRALTDGASVWVFLRIEEIQEDKDLYPSEKGECSRIFKREGYSGWVRRPKKDPLQIPGITPCSSYDAHGNYRGGGGGGESCSPH